MVWLGMAPSCVWEEKFEILQFLCTCTLISIFVYLHGCSSKEWEGGGSNNIKNRLPKAWGSGGYGEHEG